MSRWPVWKRLSAGFGAIILVAVAGGCFSSYWMSGAAASMLTISNEQLPVIKQAVSLERELLNARIHFIYHVTIQKPGSLDQGWVRFRNARQLFPELRQQLVQSSSLAEERAMVDELARDLDTYEVALNGILQTVALHENHGDAFATQLTDWASKGNRLVKHAGDLAAKSSQVAASRAQASSSLLGTAVRLTLLGCLFATILGVAIAARLTTAINRRLNLSIAGVTEAAEQIAGAGNQLSMASSSLAQGASGQAALIEETSASCSEIAAMAQRSADSANSMVSDMQSSQTRAEEAIRSLDSMTAAMRNAAMANEKVSNIIRVIDEIAFQTNILALNAAVEAARAGEAGMGFAVVADEVRNLAHRSAEAAKQTADLINQSVSLSQTGQSHLASVEGAIRALAADTARVKAAADSVSAASSEQIQGIGQISSAMNHASTATQNVAANAEEGAAAAAELAAQTAAVRQIAADLQALV